MLLAGRAVDLKAKLSQKGGKYLPTASVMKLMPAGTGSLNAVPTLERYLRHVWHLTEYICILTCCILLLLLYSNPPLPLSKKCEDTDDSQQECKSR